MPPMSATRTRAERLSDERAQIQAKDESLVDEVNNRADGIFTESEQDTRTKWRERVSAIDAELAVITDDLEREAKAEEASKKLRGHLVTHSPGVMMDGDEVVYRTFAAYARDKLIADVAEVKDIVERTIGGQAVQDAKERLMRAQTLYRAPEHTLSTDVGGLLPPTHIAQIMDVINADRPVVASGNRVDLSSGALTWPKVTQRPIVRPQDTEKTEVSTRKMTVEMKSDSAETYIGAGNLSWQAVNWSTPNALDLFFRLCAEAYAIQTEANACHVLAKAAATIGSGSLAGTTSDTFDDWVNAILSGVGTILDGTNANADTLYLSRDMFFLGAALSSDTRQSLVAPGSVNVGSQTGSVLGLNVVTSRGFESGTAIVGDSRALLVGETAGAPVRLQVVEPSIGGYEVGVIGAFKAISFDDSRFADIGPTT